MAAAAFMGDFALETWDQMMTWITAGVHAYVFPHMILDTLGVGLDAERFWPQNSLLAVDRDSNALILTPAYYAVRHLSQYVDVGAVRVGTNTADALAFENPDGTVVVVLHNPDPEDDSTTVDIDGTLLELTVPAEGWATVNWEP